MDKDIISDNGLKLNREIMNDLFERMLAGEDEVIFEPYVEAFEDEGDKRTNFIMAISDNEMTPFTRFAAICLKQEYLNLDALDGIIRRKRR